MRKLRPAFRTALVAALGAATAAALIVTAGVALAADVTAYVRFTGKDPSGNTVVQPNGARFIELRLPVTLLI